MKFELEYTHTIQCMGQDISLKGKTHYLNHDLTLYAHTFNCVCQSIRSMFGVLGIYNFDSGLTLAFAVGISIICNLIFKDIGILT